MHALYHFTDGAESSLDFLADGALSHLVSQSSSLHLLFTLADYTLMT